MLMAPFRKKKTNEAAAEDLTEELIVVAKKLYAKDCSVADNAANAVADYIRMCMTATLTAKLKSIKPTEEESDETDE